MVSGLFADGNAHPAVRHPLFSIGLGGGIDEWEEALVSLTVEAGLAPFVDVATLHLADVASAPSVALADSGTIELGYEDEATEVAFTGQVEDVRYGVRGATRITATNGGAPLSKLRVNQSYEQQKAGEIVSDLAGRAGIDTDTVEDGVGFPFYAVDDRRNAYQHIAALARKSGYQAWFTPEGKLSFAPFAAGQPVQTFTYGVDVRSLEVTEAVPVMGAVTTIGEGAAGSQGQDAWSWLVKDPSSVEGNAGGGEPERQIRDASLRSGDAAQSLADGLADAAGLMRITGKLLVPGALAVAVGSTVETSEAPHDALNGPCLVRRVRHRFSKQEGFSTLVVFSKASDGSLGGLPGGLL